MRKQSATQRPQKAPVPPPAPGETLQRTIVVVTTAAVIGIFMSLRLWTTARQYPLIPWVDGFAVPFPLTELITGATVAALVAANFVKNPRPLLIAAMVTLAVLICADQSRLQPWMYLYLWLLGAAALGCGSVENALDGLDCMRIAVIGTYLWSGLQKLQYEFLTSGFSPFFDAFDESGPAWFASALGGLRFLVPLIEILIAIALFSKKRRRTGVAAAVAMHAFILLVIGPFGDGSNAVVWPWNVAMAFLVVLLFLDGPPSDVRALLGDYDPARIVTIAAFWILPAASLSGHWDEYLSANLYSENIQEALIRLRPAVLEKLPAEIRVHVEDFGPDAAERWWLAPMRWSYVELNVPAYPEPRVYKRIARYLCGFADDPADVELRITSKPGPITGRFDLTLYDCDALDGKRRPEVRPFDSEWVSDR